MNRLSAIADFLACLRQQGFRTLSTVFGVAWGTLAVVLLLAFGHGLQRDLQERAKALGKSLVVAWPQKTTLSYAGLAKGRPLRMRAEDIMKLPQMIPALHSVSAEYQDEDALQSEGRFHRIRTSGVYPSFAELRSMIPQRGGRFFNPQDIRERRRVVFLGDRIKDDIFGSAPAVGRRLTIRGIPFTVIGVLKPKSQDSDYGGRDEERVYLPATTHAQLFDRPFISNFVFRAKTLESHSGAVDRVFEALGRIYRFDPRDRAALSVWDTTENDRMLSYFFLGFNAMLGGSGIATLLIGGIGVANLMYILVRQRTREIAVQLAVGARPRRVLIHVLTQTAALVFSGGALGVLLSSAIVWGVADTSLTEQIGDPKISAPLAGMTVLLLLMVGLAAGYFPARRAATLNPAAILSEE